MLGEPRKALTPHTGQAQIPGSPGLSVPGTVHEEIVAFVISCSVRCDEEKVVSIDNGQ